MSSVDLYIYDLSGGLAKNLGSSLGLNIDGLWHTGVVVFGEEWFFGAGGIENVEPPGSTELGSPLKIQNLGRTELSKSEFTSILSQLSHGKFKCGTYDLFRHNCNNFSQELAEIICDSSIPQYILDLPNQVLDSPVAQILGPLIEKYTQPTGRAFRDSGSPKPLFPYTKYEVFSSPIDPEMFLKKFRTLCTKNSTQLTNSLENTIKIYFGSKKESASFINSIWPFINRNIDDWAEEDLIPFLDVVRWAVAITELDSTTYKRIHEICLKHLKGQALKDPLIFRLVLRIWCNYFIHNPSREMVVQETESIISVLNSALKEIKEEKLIDSHNTQIYDEEKSTIVLYGLVPEYMKHLNCPKAAIRGIYALGTFIIKNQMAKQIVLALEVESELSSLNTRLALNDGIYEEALREFNKILKG
ncbi:DESI1 [Lepeophtheirus salmonis]|uniref:DESI1 n=1 Tax=Lepeophtheirus salmonis TaxID=72036 RepID=A0A7R8H6A0_LEPSM|nr:DESI1 [Lepeophtheirus salmonis]CAF2877770.1 DESI1 [Lepeophtheirus salmonis]